MVIDTGGHHGLGLVRSIDCYLELGTTAHLLRDRIANYELTDEISTSIFKLFCCMLGCKVSKDVKPGETGEDQQPVDEVTEGFPNVDLYFAAFFRPSLMVQDD